MTKKILTVLAGVLTVAAFVGLCYKLDLRWVRSEVHAKDVSTLSDKIAGVEKRMEQQIALDRAKKLQERIWDLEKHYRDRPMPEPVRREILMHKEEIREILRKTGMEGG